MQIESIEEVRERMATDSSPCPHHVARAGSASVGEVGGWGVSM